MKDFYYYNDNNKSGLCVADSVWLTDIGLRETKWILDVVWIFSTNNEVNPISFKEWIGEDN